MMKKSSILVMIFLMGSGCIVLDERENSRLEPPVTTYPEVTPETAGFPVEPEQSDILIDRISFNLTSFYDEGWFDLYKADELDCSRMSTYFWNYLRREYRIAPKIIVSYERQHAWIALKVRDTGNSTNYRQWNIKGVDYYYLETTIPKIVVDDNQKFIINGRQYTNAELYNASIYVFDDPQDANDFHSDYSILGGWNQEFRLKKGDLEKIESFLAKKKLEKKVIVPGSCP